MLCVDNIISYLQTVGWCPSRINSGASVVFKFYFEGFVKLYADDTTLAYSEKNINLIRAVIINDLIVLNIVESKSFKIIGCVPKLWKS